MSVELLVDARCMLGESPLWHPAERVLYWCDIPRGELLRFDPVSRRHAVVHQAGRPLGGFTIEADGSLVLFQEGGRITRLSDGTETVLLSSIERERSSRFNDVIADPCGRVLCGTMRTRDQLGVLYQVQASLEPVVVCPDLGCSNGMGFSGNHNLLYHVDTAAAAVYAFTYDAASGAITERRPFLKFGSVGGVPDGMTVDAEDHLWIAFWDGGRVARFAPDGKEVESFTVPASKVTSVTFGGADLRTLYITTAGGKDARRSWNGAGGVYQLRVSVPGRPEYCSKLVAGSQDACPG